jgi:hypothetical protein
MLSKRFLINLMAPLAAAALLLTGCASLDYPQDWGSSPGTVLPNGCPDLSGTYATRATGAYPANVEVYPPLNEILGPSWLAVTDRQDRPWPALPHATTATFTASEDWLYVSFRDDAEGEVALKFKRRHWWGAFTDGSDATYHCLVELELGPTLGFDGSQKGLSIVVGVLPVNEDTFVFLSKGRDGSLIVNYRNLQVFFPFYWGWAHSFWWRYPPVVSNQ